jgi:long-chain acyl-CoA synthetase
MISNANSSSALNIEIIFKRLSSYGDKTLLWSQTGEKSSNQILGLIDNQVKDFKKNGIGRGSICAFKGDFSLETIVIFLSLAYLNSVAVPFSIDFNSQQVDLANEIGVEFWIDATTGLIEKTFNLSSDKHPLLIDLLELGHPGLINFTSGSSGKPKAVLHDMDRVASKFITTRDSWRTVMFLLMDHFGGFNTLLSVLAYGGVLICAEGRSPYHICKAIQNGKATLLPTTPTFLNILVASDVTKYFDLTSLRLITYGAEAMPQTTLTRIRKMLPDVKLKQTYGLTEMGVLRTKSPDQESIWLEIGGTEFDTKIINGQLHVKSETSMLGYLNAPSPIDESGWMNTGDLVEECSGLIRFLGRNSEAINVGGQKVMPLEVEEILMQIDGVLDAVVRGVNHPLLGQVVVAQVAVVDNIEDSKKLSNQFKAYCKTRLQKYKIPMRFELVNINSISTSRSKKNRI